MKLVDLQKVREDAKRPPIKVLEEVIGAIKEGRLDPAHLVVLTVERETSEFEEGYGVAASDDITSPQIFMLLAKVQRFILEEEPVNDRVG